MCGAPEAPPGLGGAEGGLGVQRFADVPLVAPRDDPLSFAFSPRAPNCIFVFSGLARAGCLIFGLGEFVSDLV